MKGLFVLIILSSVFYSYSQTSDHTYHRARIYYDDHDQMVELHNLGIPVDHGSQKHGIFFESDFSETEIEIARANGFEVEIRINDVSKYYVEQNKTSTRSAQNGSCDNGSSDYSTPVNFNVWPSSNFGGFYTYAQVLQELNDMANLYPGIITVPADISNFTTEGTPDNNTTPPIGGNTIKWVKISDNPNSNTEGEPQVLYTAIHHAREPASLSQLLYFMWYLLENYASDPEIQAIVDNTELYFIPVVDPDGYLYNELTNPNGGGLWRKNRNGPGVDNNRNYNYHIDGNPGNSTWGGPGSSSNPNSDLYHGTGPFSEVENQAIKWFVEQHDFVLALNNHTFGELIYYPFGYADVPTPDDNIYRGITDLLVSNNGYFPLRDHPYSGDSDDFMYGTVGTHQKIFAMTPEISTSFWPPQSQIDAICKEMMFTNLTAAQLVGNYAIIEDQSETFIESTADFADYKIKRYGLEEPSSFTVSVNPISSNILSVGTSNAHTNLDFLEEISAAININLDSAINPGEEVTYELLINNGVYDRSILVTRTFGQPNIIFNEPASNVIDNWNNTSWNSTTEDFFSGGSSITDSPNGVYSNGSNTAITLSEPIDLGGLITANISFYAKWDIEKGYDYAQFEISTDNGQSWIPQCGKFTNNGSANQSGASGEPLYDGVQNDWVQEIINLSDYLDQSILFRFSLVSDGSVREDGFYFDELQLRTLDENLSLGDIDQELFGVYPNPVTDKLNISTTIGNYSMKLYTIQGQLVTVLKAVSGPFEWDTSALASGFYILELGHDSKTQRIKIIKQ
ncbi:MAG: immune inhibitor A [Bacteroidia bacterium]|nr:immune inhibitor A [Bacteroidia bacterium]